MQEKPSPSPQSSAVEILAAFRSDQISPAGYRALIGPAIDQARALNAFISIFPETGHAAGPLAGLPVSVKDNIAVAGHPTTGATPAMAQMMLPEGAPVARLRSAGAMFIGKTNLHELAFGITGSNAFTGDVLNPFDSSRLPGGSSSGAAVAVAVGACAVSIGTDTGGSCRIPAAHCGIVGFRPTTGRYPSGGLIALSPSRDTLGILARSVADVALTDSVMAASAGPPDPLASLDGVRLGVVPVSCFGIPGHPDVMACYEAGLERLRKAGAVLVPADLTTAAAHNAQGGFPLTLTETAQGVAALVRQQLGLSYSAFVASIVSPDVREIFASQTEGCEGVIPVAAFTHARDVILPALRANFAQVFAQHKVQALVYPTVAVPPALVGVGEMTDVAGQQVPTFPAHSAMTAVDSLSGQPSISLPCGLAAGLPVGLQLCGPRGEDTSLLALAAAVEAILPPRPVPQSS